MKNKKEKLVVILLVVGLIVATVAVSYAAFRFTQTGSVLNQITTGSITMSYTESSNVISMTGALPTTDATGKVRLNEGEYFDFTVGSSITGNTNINFEIAAEELEGNTIDGKYIKYYLTEVDSTGNETEVMSPKTYTEETTSNEYTGRPANMMSLYTGSMSSSTTVKYRLRLYVDESYNPQGDGGNLVYKVRVNVYGLNETEGKNLIYTKNSEAGYWDTSGVLQDDELFKHTDYIPVKYGANYKISTTVHYPQVVCFDENHTFVGAVSQSSSDYDNLDKYITINYKNIKYISINYNVVDEDYIYVYGVEDTDIPVYPTTVGFLGDSITAGYINKEHYTSYTSFNFPRLVSKQIGMNVKVYGKINSLISGSDATSFTSRVNEMADNLDMVVIMGGINDYALGTHAFGSIEDQTTDTFYGSLNVLLANLTEKYAGKPIVYLTPMEIGKSANGDVNITTGKLLNEYVGAIKEVCALYNNIIIIDTYTWSKTNLDPTDSTVIFDTIHPNQEGQQKIAEYVSKELKSKGLF